MRAHALLLVLALAGGGSRGNEFHCEYPQGPTADLPVCRFELEKIIEQPQDRRIYYLDDERRSLSTSVTSITELYQALGRSVPDPIVIPDDLESLGYLQELSLPSQGITGTVPSSIEHLTQLKILNLESNSLQGTVPQSLWQQLVNLEVFDLSNNALSGSIPSQVEHLTQLKTLNLANNVLNGTIPESLGEHLTNLETLNLGENAFSGAVESHFRDLTKLTVLKLENNRFTGNLPDISKLVDMEVLNLASNEFTPGNIPTALQNLVKLREITLEDINLIGTVPRFIGENLPLLERLVLKSNSLTGPYPASIGDLASLSYLSLSNNMNTGSLPSDWGQLTNLEYLYATNNRLTGTLPSDYSACTKLKRLGLSGNSLEGTLPSSWNALKNLEYVYLSSNQLNGELPSLWGGLAALTNMDLDDNRFTGLLPDRWNLLTNIVEIRIHKNRLTGKLPSSWSNLRSLTILDLGQNKLKGTLPETWSELSSLQQLILNENHISGTIPQSYSECTSLRSITLQSNELSGTLPRLWANLPYLQTLVLISNNLEGTLPADWSYFQNLRSLSILGNKLTGPLPAQWGDGPYMKNLVYIELAHNNLTGGLPPEWGKLTQLMSIALFDNPLGGTLPTEWQTLNSLTYLQLFSTQIGGGLPRSWSNLNSISYMYLGSNALIGTIPESWHELSTLRNISLHSNQLYGKLPEKWNTGIHFVDVHNNRFSGSFPTTWTTLNELKGCDISGNALSGTIPAEIGNLTSLKEFKAASNKFTGTLPFSVSSLTNLQVLSLEANALAGSLPDSWRKLSSLHALNIAQNQLTGFETPLLQFETIQNITSLDISENSWTCTCDLTSWFPQFAIEVTERAIIQNLKRTRCGEANGYVGQEVSGVIYQPGAPCVQPRNVIVKLNQGAPEELAVSWEGEIPDDNQDILQIVTQGKCWDCGVIPLVTEHGVWVYSVEEQTMKMWYNLSGSFYGTRISNDRIQAVKSAGTLIHHFRLFEVLESGLTTEINYCCPALLSYEGERQYSTKLVVDAYTSYLLQMREVQVKFGSEYPFNSIYLEGPFSKPYPFRSMTDSPLDGPQNFTADLLSDREVHLVWEVPSIPNGEIINYLLTAVHEGDKEYLTQNQYFIFENLQSDAAYVFQVAGITSAGTGPSSTLAVRTMKPCGPGQLREKDLEFGRVCNNCPSNTYKVEGEDRCEKCPQAFPYTVGTGTHSIEGCITAERFFADIDPDSGERISRVCSEFSVGVECIGNGHTLQTLQLKPGWWRGHNKSRVILECRDPNNCIPGNSSDIPPGDPYCSPFHSGILCEFCVTGYAMSDSGCVKCPPELSSKDYVSLYVATPMSYFNWLLAIWLFRSSGKVGEASKDPTTMGRLLGTFSVKIRIGLSFAQVYLSFGRLFDSAVLKADQTFASFVFDVDVAQLMDYLNVRCGWDYGVYDRLVLSAILPFLGMCFFVPFMYVVEKCRGKYNSTYFKQHRGSFMLQILLLVYPSVSSKLFGVFVCENYDLHNGTVQVLRSDVSLTCDSSDENRYFWEKFAIVGVIVYPVGVLCFIIYLLRTCKKVMDKDDEQTEAEKLYLKRLTAIHKPYRKEVYWYEAFELMRKLFQISIFVFISKYVPGLGSVAFSLLSCAVFLVILVGLRPYKQKTDNQFAIISMAILLLIAYIVLYSDYYDNVNPQVNYKNVVLGAVSLELSAFFILGFIDFFTDTEDTILVHTFKKRVKRATHIAVAPVKRRATKLGRRATRMGSNSKKRLTQVSKVIPSKPMMKLGARKSTRIFSFNNIRLESFSALGRESRDDELAQIEDFLDVNLEKQLKNM